MTGALQFRWRRSVSPMYASRFVVAGDLDAIQRLALSARLVPGLRPIVELTLAGQPVSVHEGWWVVRHGSGVVLSVSDADFRLLVERRP